MTLAAKRKSRRWGEELERRALGANGDFDRVAVAGKALRLMEAVDHDGDALVGGADSIGYPGSRVGTAPGFGTELLATPLRISGLRTVAVGAQPVAASVRTRSSNR